MDVEKVATIVVDSALQVHRRLGPGLLEGVYEAVLEKVLASRGLHIERQKPVPVTFGDIYFQEAARLDLLVDRRLIVELKSVDRLTATTINNYSPTSASSISLSASSSTSTPPSSATGSQW